MCQLPESVTVTGFSPFKGKKKERNLKEVLFVPEQLQAPPLILGWPTAAPLVGCIPTLSEAGPLQPSCSAPPGTQQRAPGNRSGPTGRGCFVNSIPFKVDPAAWTQLCSFFPLLSFQSYATHFDLQRSGRLLMWKLLVFINDLLPCSNLF